MNHYHRAKLRTCVNLVCFEYEKGPLEEGPFFVFGAGNQVRTGDLNLGKVALYQLSYSREGLCILAARSRLSSHVISKNTNGAASQSKPFARKKRNAAAPILPSQGLFPVQVAIFMAKASCK